MPATVAFTVALGEAAQAGARLTRRTFHAVHPEIPFFIIERETHRFFARQEGAGHVGEILSLRAMAGYFLALAFDRVLYFDADVLVVAPLPHLLDPAQPLVVTHDVSESSYGVDAPLLNNGVLAASSAAFWGSWMLSIYSYLLPVTEHFFDQFMLRILCRNGAFPYRLLPEREEKDYYNISYREEPGEWRWDGETLFKGEGRVRLWHWAGHARKPTLADLPPPVGAAVAARLAAVPEGDREGAAEADLLAAVIQRNGEPFLGIVEQEFRKMETSLLEGASWQGPQYPGLHGTDAPAAWDALRPVPEGWHRRLLPRSNRPLYARDPARLISSDAEALDRPGLR